MQKNELKQKIIKKSKFFRFDFSDLRLRRKANGFTLIETIVAIAILSAAVAGPLTLAIKSIGSASVSQDQMTAFYLAQEAIEYVRKVRDDNILKGNTKDKWLDGLASCMNDVKKEGGGESVYNYTGGEQRYKVPAGISQITITAYGAGTGGLGGIATGKLPVTPGETLYVYVGGKNGWNGGGGGGCGGWSKYDKRYYFANGENGGGASDVRRGGRLLSDRIIVAGGSGGGGGGREYGDTHGGHGGGYVGNDGGTGYESRGGGGGTQNVGGDLDGSLGVGGQGANSDNCGNNGPGGSGGGGGGYYGGGGGFQTHVYSGSGGGGGSSYIDSQAINASTETGKNSGDGRVVFDIASEAIITVTETNGCYIDTTNNTVNQCPQSGCPVLNRTAGGYGYTGSNGTIYTRTVKIDGSLNGGNEAKVNAEVKWQSKYGQKILNLQDNIFNWR